MCGTAARPCPRKRRARRIAAKRFAEAGCCLIANALQKVAAEVVTVEPAEKLE